MTADVCWKTETRAMRLQKDAEYVAEYLATFTPKTATEMIDKLSIAECSALLDCRQSKCFEEFSKVWNELPSLPPHPMTFFELHANWVAS